MPKKFYGFLIDPEKHTIVSVEHNGDFRQIDELIGADIFTVVQIDDTNCVYVDDEGLLKNPRYFFTIKSYHQPLAGKGLILGVDEAGDTISSSFEFDELTRLVGFTELSVDGWVTREEDDVEIFPGIKGGRITTTPIFGPPKDNGDKT